VRVIAGAFKGRRLKPPDWPGLRPTSDKLRETLFNIIGDRVGHARVLDGFAGTGAVGIEALSRGASHVTFVEIDRRAVALIAENLARCRILDGYAIIRGSIDVAWRQLPNGIRFDLVLLDPLTIR
jgi:16S rRNA (guanine966-N2)-methyltransferase